MAQGASVPALGLSNKAVYNEEKTNGAEKLSMADELYKEVYFNIIDLTSLSFNAYFINLTFYSKFMQI